MTGVYPVFKNLFKIGKAGRSSAEEDMVIIKEMESFSVSLDSTMEDWSPFEAEGWLNHLVTGKGLTISLSGKRCVGDPGNDYVASLAWKTGQECDSKFLWQFPDGAKLEFDCVVNVTNPGGGDTTAVAALEVDILSHGKPVYTAASAA